MVAILDIVGYEQRSGVYTQSVAGVTAMIEEIKPKVNSNKLRRPTKHSVNSLHRDYPHTTINGKGVIARLKKKK